MSVMWSGTGPATRRCLRASPVTWLQEPAPCPPASASGLTDHDYSSRAQLVGRPLLRRKVSGHHIHPVQPRLPGAAGRVPSESSAHTHAALRHWAGPAPPRTSTLSSLATAVGLQAEHLLAWSASQRRGAGSVPAVCTGSGVIPAPEGP